MTWNIAPLRSFGACLTIDSLENVSIEVSAFQHEKHYYIILWYLEDEMVKHIKDVKEVLDAEMFDYEYHEDLIGLFKDDKWVPFLYMGPLHCVLGLLPHGVQHEYVLQHI